MVEPLTEKQSHVLEWLHECEGLDFTEASTLGSNSIGTLDELVLIGLAYEVIVDGELVGWIPTVKGFA